MVPTRCNEVLLSSYCTRFLSQPIRRQELDRLHIEEFLISTRINTLSICGNENMIDGPMLMGIGSIH